MMLDTYDEDGEPFLCHVFCALGSQPLVEGLGEIEAFLDDNPNEVLSIIFENYITNAETASAFEESGLIDIPEEAKDYFEDDLKLEELERVTGKLKKVKFARRYSDPRRRGTMKGNDKFGY